MTSNICVLPGEKLTPYSSTNRVGGAGMKGFNNVWDANPDRLALGYAQLQIALLNEMMQAPGVKYKTDKYSIIGGGTAEGSVFVVSAQKPCKLGFLISHTTASPRD